MTTSSQPIITVYVWEVGILLVQAAKETFLFYPFKPMMKCVCLRGHVFSTILNLNTAFLAQLQL